MAVQIIFPVILQTVINLIMLSTEGEGAKVVKPSIWGVVGSWTHALLQISCSSTMSEWNNFQRQKPDGI